MKFNTIRLYVTGIFLIIGCLSFSTAEAIFTSAKALGMAAAVSAYPQDSLVVAFNPAGISEVDDRVDMGINYLYEKGRTKISEDLNPLVNGNFGGKHNPYTIAPDFGISKAYGDNLTFGLAVYNRTYIKTSYAEPIALLGTTRAGGEYIHETVAGTVAWKFHPCHAVALSINYMVQRLKVNGDQNFDNPLISAFPGYVTNKGYNYSNGVGVTIGYLGHFTRYFSFGASYQFHTSMSRFDKYKGLLADRGKFDIPSIATAGIAIHPICGLTLTFDMQYIAWREVRALKNNFLDNIFVHLAGTKDGPGFGWKNQTFYRWGLAYQLTNQLLVRLGYRHAKTPVTKSGTIANILSLDCVEDYFTAGATWAYQCVEISGFAGYGFEKKIRGNKLPVENFGGGRVDLKQTQFITGLSFGVLF